MGLTSSEITLGRSTEENYLEKSGKNSKLRQTFVISSILIIFLFFINLTPFSYADLISTIPVGTFPYGITYGTAYGNGNVYVALLGGNSVSVISDMTNSVVATIPVGTSPYGVVYGNGNIYVTNYGSGTVSVISSVTNSVVATVPVGTSPSGIAFGNGNVYVANYDSNSVSVISSMTNSVVATIPVGKSPSGIAYGNGNVYTTNFDNNTVSVISSMTNSVVATVPVGMNPIGIAYGNGNVYVTNYGSGTVSVISSVTNSVVATIPVGKSPLGVAYGIGNVYVANYDSSSVSIISSLTQSVVSTTSVGTNPSWIAFDSNNGYVYVSFIYGGSVSVLNGVVQPSITPTIISPPSISITSPSNGAIINSDSLTVSGTVSNSTAIKSIQITLDGVTSFQTSGTTWSVLLTALTSGTHTITATVTDNNGNTGTSSVTITVNTPLTISITSPTNGALLDTNTLTLSGTASGSNIQSVQVSIDGGTANQASGTTSWSFLTSPLTYGTHTITATVTDSSGKTASSSVTITVNTPLTISITSPTNGATIGTNTLMVSGTASGSNIQSVQVSIDGGTANQASGTTSWSFLTSPLTYGTHTITATVTDSSGKTATASLKIIKDSPPVLTVPADMTVIPTSTSGAPVSYTVKATDDSGQVSVACLPPSGSTFSIGTNSVTCTATDSGGNKATGSFKVTVLNPAQAIQQLMNTVNGMNLPLTVTTNLDTRLANALTNYNAGLINNAQNNLNTFINNVNSNCCSLSKPITNDQANLLTSTARNIINSM